MTQPSVIRLSETLPAATHHGFGWRHYEWPWSWVWPWCFQTICHWFPCLTTVFGYATIHCSHSDHKLFDYTLWQTATHSPPHLHPYWKSMDHRAHEWSPRSHQNQSWCLTGYIHQQLSKFSETTDLPGMVWNGLKYLRCLRCLRCLTAWIPEVSEMSEMSGVSGFRHLR